MREESPSTMKPTGWSSVDLVTAALLHRVLIARLCVVLALVVGSATLLRPVSFTSRATLAMPPSGMVSPALGGFAAQLGLGLGLSGGSRPAAFYVNLARSDAMMQTLVSQQYTHQIGDTVCRCDLVVDLAGDTEPEALAVERAAAVLKDHVSATISKEAGTIEFGVTFEDPKLAQAVAAQLLVQIERFNVRERFERASAERQFLAERLDSARAAQHDAEEELEGFLEQNRDFRNSPALQVKFDGLNREARLRQELTASINDSYEKARLEESRNTGVLVLVAGPSLPAQRDARYLLLKLLVAVVFGGGVGVGLAWGLEFARDSSLLGYSAATVAAVQAEAFDDFRRPWRLLRRPRQA